MCIDIDGVITSRYYNVTVSKGTPFSLICASKCRPGSCQVVWMTNKRSVFVKNNEEHTIWSVPPCTYKDMETNYLTVHSASSSTVYHCLLIGINGRIIDSAEQHVYVTEPGK